MIYSSVNIIKVVEIDDGTTTGGKIYVDENGHRWKKSNYSVDTSQTGITYGILEDNRIYIK